MFRLTPPQNKLDENNQGSLFWNQHIF
jgi:hypothetical protein